jgi:hypothetical protein
VCLPKVIPLSGGHCSYEDGLLLSVAHSHFCSKKKKVKVKYPKDWTENEDNLFKQASCKRREKKAVDNFTNILLAQLGQYSCANKKFNLHCKHKKASRKTFVTKRHA